jgi:hypothetical protein
MRRAWLLWLLALAAAALPLGRGMADDQPYFQDDFSGAQKYFYEGLLDDRQFGYAGGQYHIDTSKSNAYGQSVLTENLETYKVEATCQLESSSDPNGGGYGISFNYHEATGQDAVSGSDFLLFLVYDRGAYSILRYLDGRTSVLYPPTKTKLFKAGEAVRLQVQVNKGDVHCFINGGEVAQVREDKLLSGGFGLFATAQSKVHYDDFRVYASKPGGGAAPAAPAVDGFKDDFSGPKTLYEGKYNEVEYSYAGGRYLIDTSSTKYIGLSPFPQPAQNFEFSADVQLMGGDPQGSCGIYFRDHPSPTADKPDAFSQFRFLVSGDWFAVEQSIEDRPLALADWAQNPAVKSGAVNRLKVVADGGELAFFINGTQVYTFVDTSPHTGEFGLFASAGVKAAFDNVEFKKLP